MLPEAKSASLRTSGPVQPLPFTAGVWVSQMCWLKLVSMQAGAERTLQRAFRKRKAPLFPLGSSANQKEGHSVLLIHVCTWEAGTGQTTTAAVDLSLTTGNSWKTGLQAESRTSGLNTPNTITIS